MVQGLALSKAEFESRLHRTQQLMAEKELDGLIAFSSYGEREGHVCYLTNHRNSFPNVMSHMGLGHAALVLPAEGLGVLVSPFGYEADKVVGIDLRGAYLAAKFAVPHMQTAGAGAIVHIASIGGLRGSSAGTSRYACGAR